VDLANDRGLGGDGLAARQADTARATARDDDFLDVAECQSWRNPGATLSAVTTPPPNHSFCSRIKTFLPALAR